MLANLNRQFLDLGKLSPLAEKPISSISGFSENYFKSETSLAEFLFSLDIWSTSSLDGSFLPEKVKNSSQNLSLRKHLDVAKNRQLIKDFIGIKKSSPNKLIFSTLVGHSPKIYLAMYLFFVRWLNSQMTARTHLIVYLEDWFSRFFLNKTIDNQSLLGYENFIEKFEVADEIIYSHDSSVKKIIYATFVDNYLQKTSMGDFLSVLPYSKQESLFINFRDILHFVWNIYVFSLNPGIYLTSINSKREFIVFRKVLGNGLSIIFFPIAPENIDGENNDFYSRYFISSKDEVIWEEIKSRFI